MIRYALYIPFAVFFLLCGLWFWLDWSDFLASRPSSGETSTPLRTDDDMRLPVVVPCGRSPTAFGLAKRDFCFFSAATADGECCVYHRRATMIDDSCQAVLCETSCGRWELSGASIGCEVWR